MYNDTNHNDSIEILAKQWASNEDSWVGNNGNMELLLLGDFNQHHSTWEPNTNDHLKSPDHLLTPLLDLIVNMRLEMALPRDLPTLEARNSGRWTRPDNVWRCADTPSPYISCEVNPSIRPTITDHLPIISTIDLSFNPRADSIRFNFRTVKWDKFEEKLQEKITTANETFTDPIDNPVKLESATDALFNIIAETTSETIPKIKITPHMKRWWTKELSTLRSSKNRASKQHFKWRGQPTHTSHEAYKTISKKFAKAIEKAKADHWKEWIEHVSGDDLWSIHRYMKTDPTDYGRQRIPDLKAPDGTYATTNDKKADKLASTFFPPARPHAQGEHQFKEHDPPKAHRSQFPTFDPLRIISTLKKLNPFKAPGPSGISNAILKHCAYTLAPHLSAIYNAICDLNHYPARFSSIHQIVLPKPGRSSYELPNSYRPIALIETIAKVQSTIVTEDLSYECEAYKLLPECQFGGRPGRSTTDALHHTEQFIRNAWRRGHAASALFLDIQAAFPNMQKDRLIENMKARNLAPGYYQYVDMILTQRQIQLKFDDYTSNPFSPTNGCCQGCLLSMLLYAIYNAPLIRSVDSNNRNERIIGFVDDTTLLASGKDLDETHAILKNMMERKNGVFDWSRTYNSPLEMNKLALVDFTHSHAKAKNAKPLVLIQPTGPTALTHRIKPSPSAKLLGVILDEKLNWAAHHEKVRERAVKWTSAFKRYTKAAAGISMSVARKLYNAVAAPKICYAADIWYHSKKAKDTNANLTGNGLKVLTRRLEAIQRQAAIAITGAMRTAPGDAAIVHANLTPIGILLKEQKTKAFACLATRPTHHPLHPSIRRTAKQAVKNHPTALHHLASQSSFDPMKMETINPPSFRPGNQPEIQTYIAQSKELSVEADNTTFKRGINIYTDGSGYKNTIGAAAVLYEKGVKVEELQYQLGSSRHHTVFEGELTAIILGLHLARKVLDNHRKITINIDNQATIKAMNNSQPQPSQYLLDEVRKSIIKIQEQDDPNPTPTRFIQANNAKTDILLNWVAGHMGSEGNEAADALAKEAAEFGSSNQHLLPPLLRSPLPTSLSATKQHINELTIKSTKFWWKHSERYKRINNIDPQLPSMSFIKATEGLNRRQTSILTQLRTGHIPLNKHLHRIKRSETPYCPYCPQVTEDISHYLFHCNRHALHRHKLVLAVNRNSFSTRHLLSNQAAIRHTLNFINATGRFSHLFGDISADIIEEDSNRT